MDSRDDDSILDKVLADTDIEHGSAASSHALLRPRTIQSGKPRQGLVNAKVIFMFFFLLGLSLAVLIVEVTKTTAKSAATTETAVHIPDRGVILKEATESPAKSPVPAEKVAHIPDGAVISNAIVQPPVSSPTPSDKVGHALNDTGILWYEQRVVPAFKPLTRENYPLRLEEATSNKVADYCPQKPNRDYNIQPVIIMSTSIVGPASIDPMTRLVYGVINPETRLYEFQCPVPCQYTQDHNVPYIDLFLSAGESNDPPIMGTMARDCPLVKKGMASMECKAYYSHLVLDKLSKVTDFTATTDLRSDVPLVYLNRFEYDLWAPVRPKTAPAFAIAIISNCDTTRSDRLQYIHSLRKAGLSVDFIGRCGDQQHILPRGKSSRKDRIDVQATYMFSLAFENSQVDDYVTEKLYFALEAGSVPVVRGAPNVAKLAPPHSVINTFDYQSPEELVQYLTYLASAQGQIEYQKYLAWKMDPHCMDGFLNRTSDVHSFCRACIWVKQVLDLELGLRS